MPLGTLDRTPPPFFRQGASALSKLIVFSSLAIFLMVADGRFHISQPLRIALASALYPLQWLVMQPVELARTAADYAAGLQAAKASDLATQGKLVRLAERANQVEALSLENQRLRQLLGLPSRPDVSAQAAEVLYDAADPFTRKLVINQGQAHGLVAGSPVIDEFGVLGQVTRVYPLVSEVTLLTDKEQAIPVLNTRTGARGVAFGDPGTLGGSLELRFVPAGADVKVGDLLSTSGVDGVYPAGLPVARIELVERRAESQFARIHCLPFALVHGARHVMVLQSLAGQVAQRPSPEPAPMPGNGGKRGSRK